MAPATPSISSVAELRDHGVLLIPNGPGKLHDPDGNSVGAVRQLGLTRGQRAARFLGDHDERLTKTWQILDGDDQLILTLTRPTRFLKSKVVIRNSSDAEIGRITQKHLVANDRFALAVDGREMGAVIAPRANRKTLSIVDNMDSEVASVETAPDRAEFTAEVGASYSVLRVHRPLIDPLRSLVVGAAVAVETALLVDGRRFQSRRGNLLGGVSVFDVFND